MMRPVAELPPPAEASFSEAVEKQLTLLRAMADQLDKRGYCVVLSGSNTQARSNDFIYGYFDGAFTKFAKNWFISTKRRRRFPVIVNVFPVDLASPFEGKFTFSVDIPNREIFRLMNAALAFISDDVTGQKNQRFVITERNLLTLWRGSGCDSYRGVGKRSLKALLKVLEMPASKKVLLTGDDRG